jgi:hypothetical protein
MLPKVFQQIQLLLVEQSPWLDFGEAMHYQGKGSGSPIDRQRTSPGTDEQEGQRATPGHDTPPGTLIPP